MRILYLSPCGELGGAERVLLDCVASLKNAQPAWTLRVIVAEQGPLLTELANLGIGFETLFFPQRLARTGSSGLSDLVHTAQFCPILLEVAHYRRKLARSIRTFVPDIVHSNGFKMHLLASRCGQAPTVWHLHDYPGSPKLKSAALRLASRGAAGAIAISHSVAADAAKTLSSRLPVWTLPNAVDLDRFSPSAANEDLEDGRGGVRVGLVATFARWKGHEIFLRALADPRLRRLDVRASIVGGPIYQTHGSQYSLAELNGMAKKLGVAERVRFASFVTDVPKELRQLDIVVHASTRPEPFGLVIAEAMACGKPVIAADTGGASELFASGVEGIAITPGQPELLAGVIADLVLDSEKRRRMGTAARVAAEQRFDRSRLGPALASVYRQIARKCEYSTYTAEISTAA